MDNIPHINNFRIISAQDVHEKLQYFTATDKKQIIESINNFMKEHRLRTPVIRIHNSEITNLVYSNSLSNSLAMHHADVFVIDFPFDQVSDIYFFNKLIKIVMPRLREKGLVILKQYDGIRVLKKNVTYGLKSQLIGVGHN